MKILFFALIVYISHVSALIISPSGSLGYMLAQHRIEEMVFTKKLENLKEIKDLYKFAKTDDEDPTYLYIMRLGFKNPNTEADFNPNDDILASVNMEDPYENNVSQFLKEADALEEVKNFVALSPIKKESIEEDINTILMPTDILPASSPLKRLSQYAELQEILGS